MCSTGDLVGIIEHIPDCREASWLGKSPMVSGDFTEIADVLRLESDAEITGLSKDRLSAIESVDCSVNIGRDFGDVSGGAPSSEATGVDSCIVEINGEISTDSGNAGVSGTIARVSVLVSEDVLMSDVEVERSADVTGPVSSGTDDFAITEFSGGEPAGNTLSEFPLSDRRSGADTHEEILVANTELERGADAATLLSGAEESGLTLSEGRESVSESRLRLAGSPEARAQYEDVSVRGAEDGALGVNPPGRVEAGIGKDVGVNETEALTGGVGLGVSVKTPGRVNVSEGGNDDDFGSTAKI
jgi:hypothetical protein